MPTLVAKLNRPVVAVLAVGLIAGVLRFTNLEYPQRWMFDEYYYPKSACIFLGYSNDRCDVNSAHERLWREQQNDTGAWVHPPLGKWTIALGELAAGTDTFGWRIASALAGTATVMVLAVIVQLLFASPIWTFAGGLLLATESLNFVQSRIAMLDILVTFWIVLGFMFLLLDRRWIEGRTPDPPPELVPGADPRPDPVPGAADDAHPPRRRIPAPLWRPWRFASGVALGAGFATKWSALTAIMTVIALSFIWEVVRRKRFGVRRPFWDAFASEGFGLVLSLLVVPAIVYVVSYTGWFLHFGFDLGRWAQLQSSMADWHATLKTVDASGELTHPYQSQAWSWILLRRPVYYYGNYTEGAIRQVIYANGNPVIFWGSLVAIPYAAYRWWRARDWRAGFVIVAITGLYLPWFFVNRPQFLFYATPLTPFLVLACVYAIRDLSEMHVAGSRSRPYLPVAVGFVVVSVVAFAWFWPVLTGAPLTEAGWRLRYWFTS
ncbi:MAG TPA: phospholipid carrier-dependent glycosyltransferase, partial [Gemmatimonadota bacterium]|nr:phospholipid carrier-dependent glycosyltransferase [Gemmatimonadota bacterium]